MGSTAYIPSLPISRKTDLIIRLYYKLYIQQSRLGRWKTGESRGQRRLSVNLSVPGRQQCSYPAWACWNTDGYVMLLLLIPGPQTGRNHSSLRRPQLSSRSSFQGFQDFLTPSGPKSKS
ncbi:unnamed protein product [Gulo gulo]|uniref:Uncharacterized protein n=1 Tax=Gulo gulo TaxID=48420 RepID=A0A9X9LXM5_GULGU|nr:unnamed protein product [Gulo gulo]